MITPLLKTALDPVVGRHRSLRMDRSLILVWLALAALAAAAWAMHLPTIGAIIILLFIGTALIVVVRSRANAWEPDYQAIARDIETREPKLHALLLTAVEQKPDAKDGKFSYLQSRVVSDAVALSRKQNWVDTIPPRKLVGFRLLNLLALAGLFVVLFSMPVRTAKRSDARAAKKAEPVEVTPGDATVEKGSGLVVLARFHQDVPGEAMLVIQPVNAPEQKLALVKNLDDPVFGGGLPEVAGDLTYRIEYAGKATRDFTVKVFEHPRLDRADAHLQFPEYTQLPQKDIPDTRRVSAVEGSKLDVSFQLNKPVRSASLVSKDGKVVPLVVEPGKAAAALRDFPVQESGSYQLKLEDADGRASKVPAQFSIEALKNRPPEIKIAVPKGDSRVSPLEEVGFRAEVWDDFGLRTAGLSYTIAGGEEKEVAILSAGKADERQQLAHVMKLEDAGVKPDQLVSWYLWAEDVGPDGKPRRTATDIYFAEVRPFEEIFRQGDGSEGQQQQQSGAGAEAEKQAAKQKEIITATWNLKRAEDANGVPAAKPSAKYLKDEPVVRDAQAEALAGAEELKARVEDPQSVALIENVTKHMQTALDLLTKASDSTTPLPDALTAEKAAYDALLKIAAHEFRVTRRQQQSKGRQSQNNQQQLDQLEMKDDEKRYETKREATPQQNEEQREQLAVLNRLKELAQRQNDVNQGVKELQAALQEAKTEKEKEELQRQLQRLREEEQQLLSDVDELKQKMEEPQNQSRFSEERRQLDQTRSEAQKAAEAMQKGEASQALASGTRTQRQLEQLRDDVRKKSSREFTDEMRQMRTDARELAANQQQLAEQLQAEGQQKPRERRSLDNSSPQEQLAQQFKKQGTDLEALRERMKDVSEKAEAAEPLLAKELYDALRESAQAGTEEQLEKAGELAKRGFASQSQEFEKKARGEIENLKSGVERAAESVLGDEAEALRMARAEVDALAEQLNREIAKARPDLAQNNPAQQRGGGQQQQPGGQQQQPGQQQGGDQQGGGDNDKKDPSQNARQQGGGNQPGDQQKRDAQQQRSAQGRQSGQQQQGQGNQPGGQKDQGEQQGNQPGDQQAKGDQPAKDGQQPGNQPGSQRAQGQQQQQQKMAGGGQQPGGQQPGQQPGDQKGDQQGQGDQSDQSAQGQQPGQQPGKQKGGQQAGQQRGGQQPGSQQGQGEQQGQQAGQQKGNQPGQQQGQGGQQQMAGGGQQPGGQQQGPGGASQNEPTDNQGGKKGESQQTRLGQILNAPKQRGGIRSGSEGGGNPWGGGAEDEPAGPLTGENFVEWSDRLRNVEEMVDDPNLRTEIARIREVAKGVRADFKRHSVEPKWDMVQTKVSAPLAELRDRLSEELARRESKENLVPIDRDPVPAKYAERVRRYYEDLGRSR